MLDKSGCQIFNVLWILCVIDDFHKQLRVCSLDIVYENMVDLAAGSKIAYWVKQET